MPTLVRDGATVHYTDTGVPANNPDAATVFFGHGLLFCACMFHHQIAALRDQFHCVAVIGAAKEAVQLARAACAGATPSRPIKARASSARLSTS